MTIIWILGGSLLIVIGAVCVIGAILPRDHVASASIVLPMSAEDVERVIRRVRDIPSWRSSVNKVDVVEGPDDAPARWIEHSGRDALTLSLLRTEPARLIETRIDDKGMPFGGTWTFELSPAAPTQLAPNRTTVRITERGFIKPPPFRFIARFFMGYHGSIKSYLTDLGNEYGATGGISITIEE
jgi:hypothetical protein